jgi:hypothetical protein
LSYDSFSWAITITFVGPAWDGVAEVVAEGCAAELLDGDAADPAGGAVVAVVAAAVPVGVGAVGVGAEAGEEPPHPAASSAKAAAHAPATARDRPRRAVVRALTGPTAG